MDTELYNHSNKLKNIANWEFTHECEMISLLLLLSLLVLVMYTDNSNELVKCYHGKKKNYIDKTISVPDFLL